MQAYRIVDWNGRYEVTAKGRPATGTELCSGLKKGKLTYVRSRVYGHAISPSFHNILDQAYVVGEINEWAVFGLFHKLLEIAGDQEREYRGWILDNDQDPMMAADIGKLFRSHEVPRIQQALDCLMREGVRWLELANFPGKSGSSRKLPENCGGFLNRTETDTDTETEGDSEISSEDGSARFSVRRGAEKAAYDLLQPAAGDTVISDVFDQVAVELYRQVVEEARGAAKANNPMGAFIERVKKPPFDYKPVGRKGGRKLSGLFGRVCETLRTVNQ
jgi:hypothetical protein